MIIEFIVPVLVDAAIVIFLLSLLKKEKYKLLKQVLIFWLVLIALSFLSSTFILIGYKIDPIGWGENSAVAKFLISSGNVLRIITHPVSSILQILPA